LFQVCGNLRKKIAQITFSNKQTKREKNKISQLIPHINSQRKHQFTTGKENFNTIAEKPVHSERHHKSAKVQKES